MAIMAREALHFRTAFLFDSVASRFSLVGHHCCWLRCMRSTHPCGFFFACSCVRIPSKFLVDKDVQRFGAHLFILTNCFCSYHHNKANHTSESMCQGWGHRSGSNCGNAKLSGYRYCRDCFTLAEIDRQSRTSGSEK